MRTREELQAQLDALESDWAWKALLSALDRAQRGKALVQYGPYKDRYESAYDQDKPYTYLMAFFEEQGRLRYEMSRQYNNTAS